MSSNDEKILIIGASGEIGLQLFKDLKKLGYSCKGTSRKKNNSHNFLTYNLLDNIEEKIKLEDYTYCIFCCAETSILKCKNDFHKSKYINVDRTIDAIDKCVNSGMKVLFFSSDKVFPGKEPFYSIDHKPRPLTKYGEYKLFVENFMKDNHKDSSCILRLTKVISRKTPLLIKWIEKANKGDKIIAYSDEYISPLPIEMLSKQINIIIKKKATGIYQLGGKENITYFEFCKNFFKNQKDVLKLISPEVTNSISPHSSLKTFLP